MAQSGQQGSSSFNQKLKEALVEAKLRCNKRRVI
jgi:hypothetical protein